MNIRHLRLLLDESRARTARVQIEGGSKDAPLHITNLSRSGLFLGGSSTFTPGQKVNISFVLPNISNTFQALANVHWLRAEAIGNYLPEGTGVSLLEMPSESKEIFNRFIDDQILNATAQSMMDAAPFELGRAMLDASDLQLSSDDTFETICHVFSSENVMRAPVIEKGRIVGLLTSQKTLQFLLESLHIQRARNSSDLIHMSTVFAHEMATPLSALKIAQEMLETRGSALNASERKELEDIVATNTQLAFNFLETINDLRLVKDDSIKLQLNEHAVADVFANLEKLFALSFRHKKIKLIFEQEGRDSKHQTIYCDFVKINQCVANLLSNALKYSQPGTAVTVSHEFKERCHYIAVKDQGVGIRDDEIKKIFNPFVKLSNTPTAGERSSGIGLLIARNIAKAHGGDIEVQSSQSGSCFTIRIPQ